MAQFATHTLTIDNKKYTALVAFVVGFRVLHDATGTPIQGVFELSSVRPQGNEPVSVGDVFAAAVDLNRGTSFFRETCSYEDQVSEMASAVGSVMLAHPDTGVMQRLSHTDFKLLDRIKSRERSVMLERGFLKLIE